MRTTATTVLLFLLVSTLGPAAAQPMPTTDQLRRSIIQAANYAAWTLIDAEGKSRCDYEMLNGQWQEYEPAWHTGQVIWALLEAYQLTRDSLYLRTAVRAGDWWVGLAITDHPVLAGFHAALHGGDVAEDYLINFTTIADGTPGLFQLSRLTGDNRYANIATSAGHWGMVNLFLPEEGLLYDIIDVRTGEVWKDKSPHYAGDNIPLTYMARPNNEGFLYGDMYRHTGKTEYLDFFKTLSNTLVRRQSENGMWMDFHPNNREQQKIHPRFNIWNAESLVEAYKLTQDTRYLEAALRTARAYTRLQQKDGRIYYTNRPDGSVDEGSICGSAAAFAGILWLELKALGYDEFDTHIGRAVQFVYYNQFPTDHPDPNLRGAYFETWHKVVNGETWLRNRDIATSFGLRLLCKYLNTH